MLERHIDEVFDKKYHPLENQNLHKIFDYCKELIHPIDFYVDWLLDGGYYGQGVKSEWFEKPLKEGISINFGLDYDGLNIKLELSDEYWNLHRHIDLPSKCKSDAEWELNENCKQEMCKYLLRHWKDIKPELNKLVETLKIKSKEYNIQREQEKEKEIQKEKDWKNQMENFEV